MFGAAVVWCGVAPLTGQPPAGEPLPPPTVRPLWLGSASCGAASCHGGEGVMGQKGCEFNNWMATDKHRNAYGVLLSERSKHISRNYYQGRGTAPYPPPHRDPLCLNCHAHQDYADAQRAESYTNNFGVGCESCHGAAQLWLDKHYRPEWQAAPAEVKAKLGWRELRDVPHRADSCIGCHVGAPGSEVNHDLLGAGHPRLNFEFAAYHASMPHHWDDRKDRELNPYLEAQAWQIGQVKTGEAALTLLEHRAAEGKTWPEFAEYDCYACHHNLQSDSWRLKRGYPDRKPGAIPVNRWYTMMLERALGQEVPELRTIQKELAKTMPDRKVVANAARAAGGSVRGKAGNLLTPPTPQEMHENCSKKARKLSESGLLSQLG